MMNVLKINIHCKFPVGAGVEVCTGNAVPDAGITAEEGTIVIDVVSVTCVGIPELMFWLRVPPPE
jgi:hypothetical protein